jgi:hypothetical protein
MFLVWSAQRVIPESVKYFDGAGFSRQFSGSDCNILQYKNNTYITDNYKNSKVFFKKAQNTKKWALKFALTGI